MARKDRNLTLVHSQKGSTKTDDEGDEIDRLYQLPLEEFTPARNALAKAQGKSGAHIKDLQKPNAPAWAINQLYWRERPTYDRLIEASAQLRAEHHKILSGKAAEIREAEKAHRDAIREAADKAKSILSDGGAPATPATLQSINETLEALPSSEPAGRLTRPLKPTGFEALAGVAARPAREGGGKPSAPPAKKHEESPTPRETAAAKREEESARRAEEAAKRKAVEEKERRQRALADVRRAEAALDDAQSAFDKATREARRLEKAVAEAQAEVERLRRLV